MQSEAGGARPSVEQGSDLPRGGIEYGDLTRNDSAERSAVVRARVETARVLLAGPSADDPAVLTGKADQVMARAAERFALSARAIRRTAAVARTRTSRRTRPRASRTFSMCSSEGLI